MQALRYWDYYNMTDTFTDLYDKASRSQSFSRLYDIITSRENILLAYRTIKSNKGSKTSGTDGKTIIDMKKLSEVELVSEIRNKLENYRPKKVRRKLVEKDNGKWRPLGIPCMLDRIIQQSFKQVLEPIAEAQFYNHSYGFRPLRSAHHAMARIQSLINTAHFHFVVDIDIKGFFDHINHRLLIKQLWNMGIQDRTVLACISKMLKAEIDGEGIPSEGSPQGGLCEALHNPPYAKLSIMQSNLYIPYKYGLFIPFTLHNVRALLIQKIKKSMSHCFYLSQDSSVISDRHPEKLRT